MLLALSCVTLCAGCAHQKATVRPTAPTAPPSSTAQRPSARVEEGWTEKGLASWYGEPYHGRRTASGEVYNMHDLTAAHRTLPFGSMVTVKRRDTGADVTVRINDRGPFIEGRIIDLSYAAARKIALDIDGVAPVKLTLVGRGDARPEPVTEAREPAACLWVQVGAFGNRDNALRAESRLERAGEEVAVLEGDDRLWRVRIGPFDDETAAEAARSRLNDEWPGAQIVGCGQ